MAVALFAGPARAEGEGDVAAGERVFNRCKSCHTIEEGGPPKMGPNLYGVHGRQAGTAPPGSLNTAAMAESGVIWDDETLALWLAAPRDFIEGTKMTFRLTNGQDIADVIAYLKANQPRRRVTRAWALVLDQEKGLKRSLNRNRGRRRHHRLVG